MKIRALCTASLLGVVAASAAVPALAAKPKPRPKPIKGGFAATAHPDPTSNNPAGGGTCDPKTPGARVTHAFTVPAAGTLSVQLNNSLDWTGDIRDADGSVETDSDGGSPTTPEAMEVSFKRRTPVVIGVCNFAGEPTINVTYTFTYK